MSSIASNSLILLPQDAGSLLPALAISAKMLVHIRPQFNGALPLSQTGAPPSARKLTQLFLLGLVVRPTRQDFWNRQDEFSRSYGAISLVHASRVAQGMAFSVSPSQEWDGIQGPWSTFAIQVGSPSQVVRLVPSTSQSSFFVVLPRGCSQNGTSCPDLRGSLFTPEDSSTFNRTGNFWTLPIESEEPLGYNGNGEIGFDNVTYGFPGSGSIAVDQQVITGFVTTYFNLGLLGLNFRPFNISNFNDPHPSPLTSLRDRKLIPGLSFGYTAGSYNRNTYGSLTLGGYDSLRSSGGSSSVNLTVPLAADDTRDLVVDITSISIKGSAAYNGPPLEMFIDSSVNEIWLPVDVCTAFETAFGISYDNVTGTYHIPPTSSNSPDDAVSFSLAVPETSQASSSSLPLNITMPFSSFNLYDNKTDLQSSTRYFPLRRAQNATQFTLGRAFLQDAYLFVNYDSSSFQLSQAQTPMDPRAVNIVPIQPLSDSSSDTTGGGGSNTAAIAGGTVGGVIGLALVLVTVYVFYRLISKQRKVSESQTEPMGDPEKDSVGMVSPPPPDLKDPEKFELSGEQAPQLLPDTPVMHEMYTEPAELETHPVELEGEPLTASPHEKS